MKKAACLLAIVGCIALASCNSSTDSQNTKAVEEKEDRAEEAADQMRDNAEEQDTTAVIIVQ